MKILIIEDEDDLAKSIAEYLHKEKYLCEFASTYKEAIDKTEVSDYDCIVLDIMLPDGNGLKILEELKKEKRQDGVIIVSAKDALDDKIRGLQTGADDYLTKPFHLAELTARIYSVIRRKQFANSNILQQNELTIDLPAKSVTVNSQPVALTRKEFDLLIYLLGNKNRVLSKSILAEHLSDGYADLLDNYEIIYAHIKNLKKKLSQAGCRPYLKTVYGTGYRWDSD